MTVFLLVGLFVNLALFAAPASAQEVDTLRSETIAAFSAPATNTIKRTYEVGAGEFIVLDTDFGDVTVDSWDRNQVELVVELTGNQDEIGRFALSMSKSGPIIHVKGTRKARKLNLQWGWWSFGASFKLLVPREFSVTAKTREGRIVVRNLSGMIKLETLAGKIIGKHLTGELAANSSGGDIKVNNVTGSITLISNTGDIDIVDAFGVISMASNTGDIKLSNAKAQVNANSREGDIEVNLSGKNQGIELNADSGDIDIFLSPTVAGNLDAITNDGRISMDAREGFNGNIKRRHVYGILNGGGTMIQAKTISGSINIERQRR